MLADDVFDDDVGRALSFGGTRVMTGAIDTLEEVAARLSSEPVARRTVDQFETWNGEIVIPDVKVQRPAPTSRPGVAPSAP